jgi:hypothetical protein
MKDAIRDIRTASLYGDDSLHIPRFLLQLPATAVGFYRWDLIWARVDIDVADAAVPRYVKDGSGQATSTLVSVISRTTLTIGRTAGTEVNSGTAAKPALPADSATSFYIALAYVGLGASHTLATQVDGRRIREVFPTAGVAAPHGVSRLRPANGAYLTNGYVENGLPQNANTDPNPGYVSPAMQGGEALIIPLRMSDASTIVANLVPNAAVVIDDSCDWRKRIFKLAVSMVTASGSTNMPWYTPAPPAGQPFYQEASSLPLPTLAMFGANSLSDRMAGAGSAYISTFTGGAITVGSVLLALTDSTVPALFTGAKFALYIDANGKLAAWRNNVDAKREAIIWLEATAPFRNTNLSST